MSVDHLPSAGLSGRPRTCMGDRSVAAGKAVLLDAMGTLVELEPPAPRLRVELRQRFGVQLTAAEAQCAVAAEIAYYRSHLDEGRDRESLAGLRRRCAHVLRTALPSKDSIAEIGNAALEIALLQSLRFKAYPDARPAILAACARGARVVVASNWDISLHEILQRLGLAELLDGVVTSAQAGARKPSPAVFERALQIAQVGPDDAVHVGDSVREDVVGARGAGIEPILLARDGRAGPPGVRTIASLLEI